MCHSEETKAQVLAALLAGQSITQVAQQYNIPRGTVGRWSAERDQTLDETSRNTKKEIGDLLLDYLKTTLTSLKSQAEVFGDKEWLKKQPAQELAVLHGVSTDKAIRLLEALADSPTA